MSKKNFLKIWNLVALKTYNQQLFDKAANEINLCCSGMKEFNPVFTETNLQNKVRK